MASRNVEAGEILFREKPLFVGPSKTSTLICLNCLGTQVIISSFQSLNHFLKCIFFVNIQVPKSSCIQCHYPMCSSNCAENHAQTKECEIIAKNMPLVEGSASSIMKTDYQAILPLRCLLAKDTEQWNYFQMFEDHCKVHTT